MPPVTAQRILPLSADAIAQIHSSKHITSLQGVICALLENALDAEASRVEISVDWRRGCCIVSDNGTGIPSAEFDEGGSLGKLYCTSKRPMDGVYPLEVHGTSGTFLAELAAMSLLSLTSRHASQSTAAALTMYQGKVIARRLFNPTTSLAIVGQEVGTEVTVRDLFGNMPVRIKHRALAGEASGEDDKCWHELKRGVVALLLAWSKPCSVKLRDANAETKVVTISGYHPGAPNALTRKSLDQLAGKHVKSDLRDALAILFQTGFAAPDSRSQWIPLSASTSAMSLQGLICLDPAPTKQCQFLALGITPCSTASGQNELYDMVAKVFAKSSFGVVEASGSDRGRSRQVQGRRGVDRFPMYYIQLKFTDQGHASATDVERLSDSSLKAAVDILEAAVTAWLESNHFRPRKRRQWRNQEQASPTGPLRSLRTARLMNTPNNLEQLYESIPNIGKRNNAVDMSGRRVSHNMIHELNTTAKAEDLSALSKMRVGINKARPQSALACASAHRDCAEAQRVRSASSPRPLAKCIELPVKKRHTLQIASIEAGEFGGNHRGQESHVRRIESPGSRKTSEVARSGVKSSEQQQETLSSDDFGSIDDADLFSAERTGFQTRQERADVDGDRIDDTVTWTDSMSKQVFRVNSRTGIVFPLEEQRHSNGDTSRRQRAAIDMTLSSKGKPLSLARRTAIAMKDGSERPATADSDAWLPSFLEQWSNPVFARQKEKRIPVASCSGPGPLVIDDNGKACSHDYSNFDSTRAGTQLTKTALREAEVIAQVDTKFILCKMSAALGKREGRSTLILIDQHAASERLMLENLLEELCAPSSNAATSIQTTSMRNGTARGQALIVEISTKEVDLFARYRAHFARWGVLYDILSPERQEQKASRIRITHLPTPVAERCANVPLLAIEMLRSEVWALEDGSRKMTTDALTSEVEMRDEGQPLWLSLLPSIPPSLLSLIHSRSCRSAIMFNDVLSREQCVELVKGLGKCVFPFVCAHGRVSMIPLGDLGMADVEPSKAEDGIESRSMSVWLSSRVEVSGT